MNSQVLGLPTDSHSDPPSALAGLTSIDNLALCVNLKQLLLSFNLISSILNTSSLEEGTKVELRRSVTPMLAVEHVEGERYWLRE